MAGRWPDVGWLLIDRNSYDQLDPYSNTLQLIIGDFVNQPLTISDISIVQARCLTRGLASDPNAVYLLQVTNNQGVLYNPWFQFPTFSQYNVVAPAYAGYWSGTPPINPQGPTYYSGSMTGINHTDAWTWDGMVGDLWSQASSLLGAYPHLPITPVGVPQGFIFAGTSLWEAINKVLEYLGLSISGNYPNYTIVVAGATDAVYTALANKYGSPTSPNFCMEDSMEYLDQGSGRVPSQVVVYFHRQNQYYGSEETVRYDSPQWQNTPVYPITVPAPSIFSEAVGTGYLWADFAVRYDQEGNPILTDVLQAQAIAAQRVQQFYDTIYRGSQGFMRNIYTGVLPFTTGSLVDGVRWFQTGKLGDMDDRWCGWRTETLRGYVWEETTFPLTLKGLTGAY
jgi:hypothetical protein